MQDDIDGDEAMQRFEDLGRKLFQAPKEEAEETEDITGEEPQADE